MTMVQRLGLVLYWTASVVAALVLAGGLYVWIAWPRELEGAAILAFLACALVVYGIGWAIRFVLVGPKDTSRPGQGRYGKAVLGLLLPALAAGVAGFGARYGVDALRSSSDEPGLTGAMRSSFVESSNKACLEKQIADPDNKGVPRAILVDYCGCWTVGVANRLTPKQVRDGTNLSKAQIEAQMSPFIDTVGKPCLAEAVKRIEASATK